MILEDIAKVYEEAKKDPLNPQVMHDYIVKYLDARMTGLNHKPAIQYLQMCYYVKYRFRDNNEQENK